MTSEATRDHRAEVADRIRRLLARSERGVNMRSLAGPGVRGALSARQVIDEVIPSLVASGEAAAIRPVGRPGASIWIVAAASAERAARRGDESSPGDEVIRSPGRLATVVALQRGTWCGRSGSPLAERVAEVLARGAGRAVARSAILRALPGVSSALLSEALGRLLEAGRIIVWVTPGKTKPTRLYQLIERPPVEGSRAS